MPTSGTVQRQESYFIAISSAFKQQSAKDVPLANADIDILLPLVEPSRPQREQQRETVYDCDGVHIIHNYINSELQRWTFAVQPSARMFAGFMALARGAASAFSGSAANEVQTLTTDATSGSFTLSMDFEGRSGETVDIAYNASAATVKTALENMIRPIESGDITSVTGTLATSMIVTFGGKLANTNVPALVPDNTNLVGGSAAVTVGTTTGGSNKSATITRATSGALSLISFITGYEGTTGTYKKHYNQGVNSVTLSITRGQISRLQIEIIGSTLYSLEPTFTVPDCITYDPIRHVDTRFKVGGQWITGDTRDITRTYSNNMVTDEDAFPFDSIYMNSFNRGYRQTETLAFAANGCDTDDLYTWAEDGLEKAVLLYFGAPANRVEESFPVTELTFGSPDIAYTNGGVSYINIVGEPHKDATLGTYSGITYYENTSTAFLGT